MEQSAFKSPGQALMSEGMDARDRLVEEIVLLALFLVSTAANSLALLVFCRRPGLRTISNRNHGISPLHQLLLTLRFYALGTMLLSVADFIGVSKASACRIVRDVSCAIAQLYSKYIYMHTNTEQAFYAISRFPRVLGALDGTHIRIQSPCSQTGEEFRNRKGYFSLNVQAVCNANLMFMNVVARWAGSAHDATIFNNSILRAECESGLFGNKWLLGDSAYPLKSYLLTPLLNPQTRGQQLYNEAHIRTRNCIERCFGLWKRRFPVIALTLRLSLYRANAVIIATAVLHNICRLKSLVDVPPEVEIPGTDVVPVQNNSEESINSERETLIAEYFNKFVINLLATNLLTTSLLAPALLGEHSAREVSGPWVEAGDVVASTCSLAALLAVMLIALDQHHAVTDPLRCHTRLLQRRPFPLCAATWVAAVSAGAIRAAVAAVRIFYPTEPALHAVQLAYYIVYLILGVVSPIAVVCVMYSRIYRAARSSGLRARAHGASALQLHEPLAHLPDLAEEGEGLTLRIDGTEDVSSGESDRKFGPFLLPPERPIRCPSVASLRNSKKEGKSNEDLRKGLPSVSSAPLLAAPLMTVHQRMPQPSQNGSRITSIRCRISNASLFRYREESRAARVGLLTGAIVMLHVPHAVAAVASAVVPGLAECARTPSLALLLLASAASPFLFALRSRRVQREARRLFLPEKSAWERASGAASAAAADGQRARAALELLRTLSPGGGSEAPPSGPVPEPAACRGSFSSGGSTQLSSASDE